MPTPDLIQGIDLPTMDDLPEVPADLARVWYALIARGLPRFSSEAMRETAYPSPAPGQVCVLVVAGVPLVQIFKSGTPTGSWVTLWSDPAANDTGWVAVDTNSGFTPRSSAMPQVRRIGNEVFFRGGWDSTGMSASGSFAAGTIPEGFRPPAGYAHYGQMVSSTNATSGARLAITQAGVVTIGTLATLGTYYVGSHTWLAD